MKPRKLTITAFGPYKDTQVIDFDELGAHTLFLMHGSTGAGKTTLLDAMCVALFGETSGGEREAKELRSDLADPQTVTRLEFDFTYGDRLLRVKRQPQQPRPGRKTPLMHDAELWEIDAHGREVEPLAQGVESVKHALTTLLGLSGAQFRQVVVLPQGQFRELLTAESAEREGILKVLFDTADHAKFEKALKDLASTERAAADALRMQRDAYLTSHDVQSTYQLGELLESDRRAFEQSGPEATRAQSTRDQAKTALDLAATVEQRYKDLDAALAAQARLEADTEVRRRRQEDLAAALRALEVRDEDERAHRTALDLREHEGALLDAQNNVEKAEGLLEKFRSVYEREAAREEERRALHLRVATLTGLQAAVDDLQNAREELARFRHGQNQARQQRETLELEKGGLNLEASEQRVRQAQHALELLPQLEAAVASLTTRETTRRDLWDLERGLPTQRPAADRAKQEELQADLAWAEHKKRHGETRELFLRNQAGVLARALHAGEPCAVCGSVTHPSPAVLPEHAPLEADVKRAETDENAAFAVLQDLRQKREKLETLVKGAEQRAEALRVTLGSDANTPLAALRNELKTAQDSLAEVRRTADELDKHTRAHEEVLRRLGELDSLINEKRELEAGLGGQITQQEDRVQALTQKLPEDLRSPGSLSAELQRVAALAEKLDQAFAHAKSQHDQHLELLKEVRATSETAQALFDKVFKIHAEQEGRVLTALRDAGFATREDYEAARLIPTELDVLQQQVERDRKGVERVGTVLQLAREAVKDQQRPDLGALQDRFAVAQRQHEELSKRHASLEAQIERRTKDFEAAETLEIQYHDRNRHAQLLTELAQNANGNGRSSAKISYHRYVLGYYLDMVLGLASQRLRAMTGDRYDLRRSDDGKGGLELEVFDHYTGRARSARTLSGGESFQAALSLALSLADVVQQRAGARYLETVFIDEGFGSLDPDALDLAMECLAELQRSGRLVGVISHVQDLQHHIPARLEVTRTRQGSSARFVMP